MQYFSLLRLCSVLPTETAVPLISAENELADFEANSAPLEAGAVGSLMWAAAN